MSANSFVQQLKWNTNIAQKLSVILKSILMSNQQTTICFLFLACWRVSSRSFLAVSLQEEINVFTVGPTPHSPTTLTAAAGQTHTGRNCRGTSRLFIYPFMCLFVCLFVLLYCNVLIIAPIIVQIGWNGSHEPSMNIIS